MGSVMFRSSIGLKFLGLLALPLCLLSAANSAEPGFTPLFNGKDLSGWKAFARESKDTPTKPIDPKQSWRVEDGVLVCTGQPIGYLATDKEYDDYTLKLKWRYPKGTKKSANSGILLHCQKEDRVWPSSVEAQLKAGSAGDIYLMAPEVKMTFDAAHRDEKNPKHAFRAPRGGEVEKPFGEWNQYEITCKGGAVTFKVNGNVVNEGKEGNLTKGRIALQSEGAEIHFKDIEIKLEK